MKRSLFGLAAALALAAFGVAPAVAQSAPSGSYQNSCTNLRVRGDVLYARCNLPEGGTARTSISIRSCRSGDIANVDGQLVCNRNAYNNGNGDGYAYGRSDRLPSGSYQASCTNILTRGSILSASCTAPNGSYVASTLDVSACGGYDVVNRDGYLRCGTTYYNGYNNGYDNGYNGNNGYLGGIPAGSYQVSCTNVRTRGSILSASCTAPNGSYVASTLDVSTCGGYDVVNRDGYLRCGTTYYNGYNGYNNRYSGGIPGGSYQSSCSSLSIRGSYLTATCTAPNGANITSTLDVTTCNAADIANRNGYLRCQ